ncbi:MAG: spore coat associated protein CotJA [Clostridia bacterium]|nr:spore coat associated protein CotJA [Clostridia bacterium]
MVPAMAYVPTQVWGDVYCPEEGLARGTIFAVLDKPFVGRQGGCCR